MDRFRPRLSYANVVSTLCLILVVGGGVAYAANTVGSDDIINGQVKSVDIGTGQVRSVDVGNDNLTGADVADNGLGTAEIAAGSLFGSDVFDGSITSADLGTSSVASSEIANGSITGDDIGTHTVGQGDIDGTDHYGALGVGGVLSGRCTTITVSIGGSQAGDAGMLTTDGTLPDGELIYLQRVLDDNAQVKICNLSGGDLPAITVNVRIVTFH
jgi:hypothetical protein